MFEKIRKFFPEIFLFLKTFSILCSKISKEEIPVIIVTDNLKSAFVCFQFQAEKLGFL